MSETKLHIWTDGACKGNPGVGGWGVLMRWGVHRKELFGGSPLTTNNRMELTAVISALRSIKSRVPVVIHTDSAYVRNGITVWIANWKRKGWRTASGEPVKNVDLWRELDTLAEAHSIEWMWVKGHAGDPGNERADELANMGCMSV